MRSIAAGAAGVGVMRRLLVASCIALVVVAGCKAERAQPSRMTTADFANLRWLEGDWRGQIASGGYFYERYHFVDDSTIAMHGYEDSTFTRPNDSATIVFRDGVVSDIGPKAKWSASRLDSTGIDFAPVQGATNHFTWTRQSGDKWTAAIKPANGKVITYQMERPPAKVEIKLAPRR